MSSELRSLLQHAERMAKQCQTRADGLHESARATTDLDVRALAESDAAHALVDLGLWNQIADEIREHLEEHPDAPAEIGAGLW